MSKKLFGLPQFLLGLLSTVLMVSLTISLTACGDDDDDNPATNTGGNTGGQTGSENRNYTWPTWTDIQGRDVQLLALTEQYAGGLNNRFYLYDQTGRLSSVFGDDVKWTSGSSFTIAHEDEDYGYTYTINATLNNDGLISKLTYKEEEDGDTESGTCNFTYNSNHQMTKISETGTWNESNEHGTYTFTETYTWSNGNLVSSQYTEKEEYYNEDGDYEEEEDGGQSTITYSNQQNPTLQFPYGFADDGLDIDFSELAALGLLGIGPKSLPTRCSWDGNDGTTFTYTLNNNGTINTETYYWSSYSQYSTSLTYTYADNSGNSGNSGNNDSYKKAPSTRKQPQFHHIRRHHVARR